MAVRVFDEPLQLLTGPAHPLAGADTVTLTELVGHRIRMPSLAAGTEWAAFYADLAAAFSLTIDPTGPDFGIEPLLDALADSPEHATFVGARTRFHRPDLRRIGLRDPTPLYPHSLLHRTDAPHPALPALRTHLGSPPPAPGGWTPAWARS